MRAHCTVRSGMALAAAAMLGVGIAAGAQRPVPPLRIAPAPVEPEPLPPAAPGPFSVLPSSVERLHVAAAARFAEGRRIVVSLDQRRLWWMDGDTVLHSAPVAVGKGTRLEHRDRVWDFATPHGVRRVRAKQENPVWVPPDWHYVELAADSAYALVHLRRGRPVALSDGSALEVRGDRIVRVHADGRVEPVPADEEVIFGRTLYVPPLGTANRRVVGELGAFKLDLGDGYMLHGTPHSESIGRASTHGCIRLRDEDVEYLFRNVPPGAPVYLF